eukprot:Protomagalhaensia_sp_Gyna_25__5584@NODE_769_length_2649_cov_6_284291_g604_i0_p1_GENE_NODE_769_length_2649_cov_6_284291_g604_i0NODE_769_length_2649_cov_6_284291_g604_i0_p1_ORF_typecomplete_len621_score87_11Pkinase/PF00069_25/1_8e50Pkinase_Tyr/PF07714_17/5_2e30Kdo/PF06293_14/1_3e13Kinaselike/PF14531_6/2_6e09WaaY/PF06176_11/5_8e07Pkinase_fungal/PF17667_1/2_1e06RIO1/PF01163_22/2_9e05APH/PF01636_23/0_00052YrbLPhoP_reg/PF10707_9/5_8e05Choline_kinase/PF01633_20/0_022EcKinase/PF02958_20/0_059FTA2/PF1309
MRHFSSRVLHRPHSRSRSRSHRNSFRSTTSPAPSPAGTEYHQQGVPPPGSAACGDTDTPSETSGRRFRSRHSSRQRSVSARRRAWSRGWKSRNFEGDASDSETGQSTHRGKHLLQFWKNGRHSQTPPQTQMPHDHTPTHSIHPNQYPPQEISQPYKPPDTPLSRRGSSNRQPSYDSRQFLTSLDRDSSTAPPTTTEGDNYDSPQRRATPTNLIVKLDTIQDTPAPQQVYTPHLSAIGTPIDLATWFYPKKWVATRFRAISTLAPAIHGEVRYVLDVVEKKAVVVKVIHNSAVRPRLRGELENPLVEIGAMTYLHSKEARYPVDLVAKLHGVYQDAKFTYLVTEYCSGGELFRLVIDRKCFNESFVKAIALQLALALLSLHKNGICHRDVSLENTLLKQDKTVRLIDFGQAETIFDASGRERMMSGSAGKDYYRAPEMIQKEYRGPPVDVFALGVEIFIMAIGSPPWQEASESDPRYRAVTQRADALDVSLRKWGKRDKVSDAFVDMLAGIFCSSPSDRPTIEELLLHPWFAYDPTVWRWVYNKGHSVTIKAQAERLDAYLKTHQAEFFFQNNGRSRYQTTGGSSIPKPSPDQYGGILGSMEPRSKRDDDRSATRHRRPYA